MYLLQDDFYKCFSSFPVEDPIQDHCIAFSCIFCFFFFFFFKLEDNWFTVLCWWAFLLAQWVKNPPTMPETTAGRHGFDPWEGKIPKRRAWQPTPVFLPVESHGQRSLMGYSLWGHEESDMTEATEHAHILCWFLLYNSVNQL